jgi:hypothetical protein
MPANYCPQCGAARLSEEARFCIECGAEFHLDDQPEQPIAETAPAVHLPNARVDQRVLGGTVRLPTANAVPPGMWLPDTMPTPTDVVAVYVPLKAIVSGWSGLSDAGWALSEQLPPESNSTSPRFRFQTVREWFPADGQLDGQRLMVRVEAEAEAEEGRSRRGFRYRSQYDPPMTVRDAWWADRHGRRLTNPLPRIQLMAPPRIPRISDFRETIQDVQATDALAWAREGKIHEPFHLLQERQQRTPVGRGLPLGAVGTNGVLAQIRDWQRTRYYVQLFYPLICTWKAWEQLQASVQTKAAELGLNFETDATVEWWLDQQGYDSVVFDGVTERYGYRRAAIAFRRAQIVRVRAS